MQILGIRVGFLALHVNLAHNLSAWNSKLHLQSSRRTLWIISNHWKMLKSMFALFLHFTLAFYFISNREKIDFYKLFIVRSWILSNETWRCFDVLSFYSVPDCGSPKQKWSLLSNIYKGLVVNSNLHSLHIKLSLNTEVNYTRCCRGSVIQLTQEGSGRTNSPDLTSLSNS